MKFELSIVLILLLWESLGDTTLWRDQDYRELFDYCSFSPEWLVSKADTIVRRFCYLVPEFADMWSVSESGDGVALSVVVDDFRGSFVDRCIQVRSFVGDFGFSGYEPLIDAWDSFGLDRAFHCVPYSSVGSGMSLRIFFAKAPASPPMLSSTSS